MLNNLEMGFDEWSFDHHNSIWSQNLTKSSNENLTHRVIKIIFVQNPPNAFNNCWQFPTMEPTLACLITKNFIVCNYMYTFIYCM